ncbi:DNA topoisomerase IV, alpha subunit [Cutaneotrichosporon oleaginosum]|uniref:DNA topoisomerase (ATP-hydrolyzing) n=1 Tax=Cutaneotrichosporon oleaginosum TaxID=879819 RepID=A0A0J1B5M1_9TREE|nr:DNA topoisomerase IV, alpha subunit [Cutaneotrichosporon oleaginosum]KLT42989.1 DNA topoisomerase IV, alpha subunit [Cutaneotrichosporon oleaginosum]
MTRILLVASVLYEAILNNCVVTLREIFYRDVALFRRQGIVDGIVDDIVATIGLRRADFHVCAAAKGLIASNALKVNLTNGDSLSISSATGKGFPDLASLQLLRRLADQFPAARIGVLVDADPSGIAILSAYAYGSKANRHSEQHSGLPLGDRIEYLGVKATEWSAVARYEDLLPLSPRDARLAKKMCADLANVNPTWRRELVHMLHLNRKAEIQILSGLLASADDGWPGCRANNDHLMGTTNHLVEFIVAKLNRPHVR